MIGGLMKRIFRGIATFIQKRPATDWFFVVIALALFASLTLWNISGASIWFDEAFGAYLIQYNVLDIARYTATDVHPPLFYWLLKGWSMLFGTTELGLRTMSVFFGAVAAIFGFLLVRRQFGRRAAVTALFILVLSPLFIRYSQEARMYTLAAAIVLTATYVLTLALESRKKKLWILYGVLVSLGMWTHYFTALAWISHWVWRFIVTRQSGVRGKDLSKKFFDRNWIMAHIIAVGLFLPWLPAMALQLGFVQATGFWITPVGADNVPGYFGTLVYYLEHDHVVGWWAALLVAAGILVTVLAVRSYKSLGKVLRRHYILLLCLAAVPPLVLFAASLPPLESSFVERYLLPAAAVSALFVGVTLTIGLRQAKPWKQIVVFGLVGIMLIYGITNVYFYGNYNKNSRTDIQIKQLVQQVTERADPGEPIIASSPWTFYEAVFYNTEEHPVYFLDSSTKYEYGSLDMLKYNDWHKIKDLSAFAKEHPKIWYIGYEQNGDLMPAGPNWHRIDSFSITSRIDGQTFYKASEFTISQK